MPARPHSPLSRTLSRLALAAALALGAAVAIPVTAGAGTGLIRRASTTSAGGESNQLSEQARINEDGRYVVFKSAATNLDPVASDGSAYDVYVKDLQTGTLTVMSASGGTEGNGSSGRPDINDDGSVRVFQSNASDLVGGDANGAWSDIFMHTAGGLRLVSSWPDQPSVPGQSTYPVVSGDGRYVAYQTNALVDTDAGDGSADGNGSFDVLVWDSVTSLTETVSITYDGRISGGGSQFPSISDDGRYVALQSSGDLVSTDTAGNNDVYLRDTTLDVTTRVSVGIGDAEPDGDCEFPAISGDGRFVAFVSDATNLVPGDTNGLWDVFVRDLAEGTTELVSLTSSGALRTAGGVATVYGSIAISDHGEAVAFGSDSTQLVPPDTNFGNDVFVRDLVVDATYRGSVTATGGEAWQLSKEPSLSDDGRYLGFYSEAVNLVGDDANGRADIFVTDLWRLRDDAPPVPSCNDVPNGWTNREVTATIGALDYETSVSTVSATWPGGSASATGTAQAYVPVTAEGVTDVEFWASDVAGNESAREHAYVRIDYHAPETASNAVGAYTGGQTISLSASETLSGLANTSWWYDGGGVTSGTAVTVPSSNGTYNLNFLSTDQAGNRENTCTVTFTVTVPPPPPTPPVTPPPSDPAPVVTVLPALPGHTLTTPSTPSTVYYGRTFTAAGILKPRHTAGAYSVKLYLDRYERQSNGTYKWVRRATWSARNANYSSYTKYYKAGNLKLRGKWRVRAGHAHTGYATKYSGYRYFYVR